MKKFINDKSPFSNSLDEMDGQVLILEGHDRPRYIYPFNSEAGYLGLTGWAEHWNKPTFNQEGVGELDSNKYYSIIVVPYKSDIAAGGLPIMGEPTQRAIPIQPTAGFKSIVFNIPTHEQQVIKDCGIAYYDATGTMTDENKTGLNAWITSAYVGKTLKNVETGLTYPITANTATVITATGSVFSVGDRYQILSDTVTGRFIYAAEMPSSNQVVFSNFYLIGIVQNNTETTYALERFFEGADIWDFSAGYFPPPNANCVKNVSGIMFCGGGITDESGLAEYKGAAEVRAATAASNKEITLSYIDDTYTDANLNKIVRITLGSSHSSFADIHVGSYVTITGASNPANNVESARVLRVDPAGMWIEFENDKAEIATTVVASTPIITTGSNGTIDTVVPASRATTESWVLTCIAGSFAGTAPVIVGASVGNGVITTPVPNADAVAETWTLTCTAETNTFSAGTVTKSGTGSWTTAPIPSLKALAVAETWTMTCTYKRMVPVYSSIATSGLSSSLYSRFETPVVGSNAVPSSSVVFTCIAQTTASASLLGTFTLRPTCNGVTYTDIVVNNNAGNIVISAAGVSLSILTFYQTSTNPTAYAKFDIGDTITVSVGAVAGGGSTFSVVGGVTGNIGFMTSGTPYLSNYFGITIPDGTTPWEVNDTVQFTVSAIRGNGARFSVVGSLSGVKANLTSGQQYSNSFFSILVGDGSTKWATSDSITFDVVATADASAFSVVGDRSGVQAPLTIDELYTNDYFSTTVNSGTPTWQVGDSIFFTTTKTFAPVTSTTMQASVIPNYIKGVLSGEDATNFTEGMVDAKFMFVSDRSGSYYISWVDPITQKIGISAKYTGNNTSLDTYKISSDPSLYYSDSKNPHRVRSGAIVDIGDSITGISSVGDNVLVFCRSSLWRVSVESLGAHPVLISDNIRCPAQFSIVKGEKLVAFYDGTGISVTDGVTAASRTSYKAKEYLANINKAYEQNIVGVYDRENRRFEFVFPMGDETQNNYGLIVTEDTWNCYPSARPDCNALWTNYDSGNLRVYHGTTGEKPDNNGIIWKHDGNADGTVVAIMTITAISGQVITISATEALALTAGDVITIYPVISGEPYSSAIIEAVETITENPYTYEITLSALHDLTAYVAGDLIYSGYIPFDYGIKWTDFSSPQYRHQVRNIQIDLENMTGKLYVDHFLDMNETPVAINEYDVTPADSKITVPFRMGKCYKYGFRLRGVSSTQLKISSFELMFDSQV